MTCPRGTAAVEGHAGLCRVTDGAFSGVVVNEEGVVDSHLINVTGDASDLMRRFQGEEVNSCSARRMGDTDYTEIPGVTFTGGDIARLRDVFGSSAPGTHRVVLCSGVSRPGLIGIDLSQQSTAKSGITRLMSGGAAFWNVYGNSCTSLFTENASEKCEALVDALRLEYRTIHHDDAAFTTPWESVRSWAMAIGGGLLGLFGVFLVFGPAIHRYNDSRNNRKGGGNDGNPPTAGAGGGGAQGVAAVVPGMGGNTTARVAMPDVANGILAFHQGANGHTPAVRAPGAVPVTGAPIARPGIIVAPVIPAPVPVPAPVVAPIVVPRPVFAIP